MELDTMLMLADGQRRMMGELLGGKRKESVGSLLFLFDCRDVVGCGGGELVYFSVAGVPAGVLSVGDGGKGFFEVGRQYYLEVSQVQTEDEE